MREDNGATGRDVGQGNGAFINLNVKTHTPARPLQLVRTGFLPNRRSAPMIDFLDIRFFSA
jgi:hypothetical protein